MLSFPIDFHPHYFSIALSGTIHSGHPELTLGKEFKNIFRDKNKNKALHKDLGLYYYLFFFYESLL